MTPDWPYPFWVAHRGAGKLAPENTLAAFKLGARHGYRMFECDVKLSSDGVPFLLHDDTLERTTNGQGMAGLMTWAMLQKLDAGSWHSAAYAAQPQTQLASLQAVSAYCIAHDFDLNIEIKPTAGTDRHTGEIVARHAAHLWRESTRKPLLTSFKPGALQAAQRAVPSLPRGLLLQELREGWLEIGLTLGCRAIVCNHTLWDCARVMQAKAAGFKTLSYTVNDATDVQRLLALETDGIITDRVDAFKP